MKRAGLSLVWMRVATLILAVPVTFAAKPKTPPAAGTTLPADVVSFAPGERTAVARDGKPLAAIVLPAEPTADETLAAEELREHLKLISGAELPIVQGNFTSNTTPIRIGAVAGFNADKRTEQIGSDEASYMIAVDEDGIKLIGRSPKGALFATYELLERLGVRWYMPGKLGTVIPKAKHLEFGHGVTFRSPSFRSRYITSSMTPPFSNRVRLGGEMFPSAHGIKLSPPRTKEDGQELYALVNGKRLGSQLCVSNPEAVKRAVAYAINFFKKRPDLPWIGMGPNDGSGFCECENCRALDSNEWDSYSSHMATTDRYVWFFNQVVAGIHKVYPGKKLCFYAYHTYTLPPRKHMPDKHIVPAFAPISLCRIHGMSNPVCPDRSFYKKVMIGWGKVVPEIFERGYYFNLACPGFPFSKVHAVRDEIVEARKAGVTGWKVEGIPSWVTHTPTTYVASRLMWDVDTDVDALLDDFYVKFFGDASKSMKAYFEMVDHAFRDTDTHTGGSFCMPKAFTPERLELGRRTLTRAMKDAGRNNVYARRVAMFELNFQFLEAFIAMLEARDQFDFALAKKELDDMRALNEKLISFDLSYALVPEEPVVVAKGKRKPRSISAMHARTSIAYVKRFWSATVESGYERVVERGDLVAGLPDEWGFLADLTDVGESAGWFADGITGGNWRTLRTKTASWSDQGMHYYKGVGWYRTTVRIPKRFKGRKLYLWFGGVDEQAKVWFNGQLLGASADAGEGLPGTAGTFLPFEFNVTKEARVSADNTIVVKVTNKRLDEVGTGGIVSPVMLWSPKR